MGSRQWTVGSRQWAVASRPVASGKWAVASQSAKFKVQRAKIRVRGQIFQERIKNEAVASILCRISTLYSILSTLYSNSD